MHIDDLIHILVTVLAPAKYHDFSTTLRMIGISNLKPMNMGIRNISPPAGPFRLFSNPLPPSSLSKPPISPFLANCYLDITTYTR
jgi:hypothetical protein